MKNEKTQVFLSYKYHNEKGEILPDYYMAKELYEELKKIGINTFFSDKSIMETGKSDYKRLIDKHLDEASLLIVVSTAPEHCDSNWVRYEWDSFYNDILSEQKSGELISYLDTDDIRMFPRTIRTLQIFEKNDSGLNNLISFVRSFFNIPLEQSIIEISRQKGSSYNYEGTYELGDERKRLAIQAKVESAKDNYYISNLLVDDNRQYKILDVGCSMGAVTFDIFGNINKDVYVLGVDKFQKCVDGFNAACPYKNMYAERIDLEEEDWFIQLEKQMVKHNIDSFDLIYCSLSLHHMSDSESVLKRLWKYTSDEGYVYIRTCDDALKLAYPNGEAVYKIIQMTANVPNASDRFHGRKVYSMLYKAKYKNITMKSFLIDTGEKDIEERYALYYSTFVWRKNYFKNRLDAAKSQEEIELAMSEYNEVTALLDEIENKFTDKSFYFGYYVNIAIAQKRSLFKF